MSTFFLLLSSILIIFGMPLLARGQAAIDSPVVGVVRVTLEIDFPANSTFGCSKDESEVLQFQIDKVIQKKISKYYEESAYIYEDTESTPPELCLELTEEAHPQDRHRELQLVLRPSGWSYTSNYKCSFCNDDNADPDPDNDPDPVMSGNGTIPPDMPGNETISLTAEEQAKEYLLGKLEKSLTRGLTRKVNRSRKSCLRHSGSTVTVFASEQKARWGCLE